MKKIKRIILFLTVTLTLYAFSLTSNAKAGGRFNPETATKREEMSIGMAVEFTSHSACAHIAKSKGWFKMKGLN